MPTQPNMQAAVAAFNAEVVDFGRRVVPEVLVKVHKKLALEALTRVVQRTPVDTGRARANWMVTINRQLDVVRNVEPGEDAATSMAMRAGTVEIDGIKPFVVSHIDNNVPYIEVLEQGRVGNRGSKQAPHGMVRITFEELKQMFHRITKSVRGAR